MFQRALSGSGGGGGEIDAVRVDMTFNPTFITGHAIGLEDGIAEIEIYTGSSAHGIGNMDVSKFKRMSIQRTTSNGQGIGIFKVSSLSDSSKSNRMDVTWDDTSVHDIDLTGVDFIFIWGDGTTTYGYNRAKFWIK